MVSLQCDIMYSLDEFYRQLSQAMKQGKLITFDIFKSIIHSNIQMTYKKVNKILNENIVEICHIS